MDDHKMFETKFEIWEEGMGRGGGSGMLPGAGNHRVRVTVKEKTSHRLFLAPHSPFPVPRSPFRVPRSPFPISILISANTPFSSSTFFP